MSDVIEAEVVEGSTVTPSSSLQLKYKFNAGQPTLLNQEGKKVYGKDLLIAIRDSPLSWKMPDVKIKSLLLEERAVLIRKGHSQVKQSFSRSEAKEISRETVHHGIDKKTKQTEGELKNEDFFKKVRGILNKLTPEKFDTLVLQLKEQRINSLERLSGVVDLVFEKAVKEPSFSKCYADMCKMIGGIEVLDRVKVATEDTNPRKPKQQVVHFRQLLLRKCQYEFEKNKVAEFDAEKRMAEIKANKDEGKRKELKRMYEEDERKIRTRSVGLVSFIAELYKLKMLSPHIMHYCVKQLISKIDEESLECLCKLLMTIGKDLEKQSQEDEMHYRDWNYYFDKMAKLSAKHENSKVSSRIRFMLQDLIELRGNQWIPRHSEKRPLKFSEINKEVERETLLNNIEISANAPRSMCNRGQNNHWRNQRGGECQNEKGWQTVTSTSFGNCPFKVGKPQHMKNTQQKSVLGPMKEIKRLGCEAGMISTGCFDEGVTPTRKPTSLPSPNLTDARRSVSSRSGASDSPSRHHLGVKYPHSRSGIDVLPPSSALQQPSTSTWMPVAPPADPSAPVSELMPYNLKRRVEDILTILSTHNDVEEAIQLCKKTIFGENIIDFAQATIQIFLEENTGLNESNYNLHNFLRQLIVRGLLSPKTVVKTFSYIFRLAEDIVRDLPSVWVTLAELLVPFFCLGVLTFTDLKTMSELMLNPSYMPTVLGELFRSLVVEEGPIWLRTKWESSKVSFKEFMAEDIESFFHTHTITLCEVERRKD